MKRRTFLKQVLGATAAAVALPGTSLLGAAETAGRKVRKFDFVTSIQKVSAGVGPSFNSMTYNGQTPGPLIRIPEGDILRVVLKNKLPEDTTIHFHGVLLPFSMSGVEDTAQAPVKPGGEFVYEFEAKPSGTFWYHSHIMYQPDQGLIGALVIEPRREERAYDQDVVMALDDLVMRDGGGAAPSLARRPPMGMGMGGSAARNTAAFMAMGAGTGGTVPLLEPVYDGYAVNGKVGSAIEPIVVNKGDRVRLRFINMSACTVLHLQLAGHPMLITHTDSRPVQPIYTDVLRIAMGERYDVEILANNPGRWVLGAMERGYGESRLRIPFVYKGVQDRGLMEPDFQPGRRLVRVWDMQAPYNLGPAPGPVNRFFPQILSGGMHGSPYWTINGLLYPNSEKLTARLGERVRLGYRNHSMMPHPMHLHGNFFKVVNPALPPERWIMKDTVIVDPMQYMEIEYMADYPGDWIHHCHNEYHMMAGMANLAPVVG